MAISSSACTPISHPRHPSACTRFCGEPSHAFSDAYHLQDAVFLAPVHHTDTCTPCCACAVLLLHSGHLCHPSGAISTAQAARKLRKIEPTRREKDSKDTQASAYSYSAGNDPGGAGDAFTWINAEASASSGYNGVYYNDGEWRA